MRPLNVILQGLPTAHKVFTNVALNGVRLRLMRRFHPYQWTVRRVCSIKRCYRATIGDIDYNVSDGVCVWGG